MRPGKMIKRAAFALVLTALAAGVGTTSPAQAQRSHQGQLATECRGDSFRIDIAAMQDTHLGHAPEERIEQWRDWIATILFGRLEVTTGSKGLLISNASRPLIRDDALAHVLDHHMGITRSATGTDGEVVVMVERGDPTLMKDAVLEAIDQEALHLAATPSRAIVYQYEFDERAGYAHLCRIGTFNAAWMQSAQQGFRRTTVRTSRDLDKFLDGGVDLLTAQCTNQGLKVTGRNRLRTAKAPVTAEHVAALGQVQYVPTDVLGVSPGALPDEWQEWIVGVGQAIDNPGLLETPEVKAALDSVPESENMFRQLLAWKRQHPHVASRELVLSWLAQQQKERKLGFSLDPKLRAKDTKQNLDALVNAMADHRQLAALLYAWNVDPTYADMFVQSVKQANRQQADLKTYFAPLQVALMARSDREARGILKQVYYGSSREGLTVAARLLYEHSTYQCARYDGPLQGTLTGMTMFYTDLLMKLWGNDQFDSAPEGLIPGFESIVGHELSGAHCTDAERRYSTRAWLGLREEQYARERKDRTRFAPVATRIFAKSSRYGAEYGKEFEATAEDRRFVRWWNAHYARVADWEPQYELLNQIMKWSVVVQSAALSKHQGCTRFLDEVAVNRSHRFDQWVTMHDDLRWRGPVSLVHRDEPTECLPVLRSRTYSYCGRKARWVGGVSAAHKATVANKPVRTAPQQRQLGRFDARSTAKPNVADSGRITYKSVSKPDGALRNVRIDPRKRSFTAQIDTGRSQRGARHSYGVGGADRARPITRLQQSRRLVNKKLVARDTLNNNVGVAHLRTNDLTDPVIKPKITPREAATMRELGHEVSKRLADGKTSLSQAVADMPRVPKAWQLRNNNVLVKVNSPGGGSPRYGIMSSSGGIRGPPGSLRGRFGAARGQSATGAVEIRMLSQRETRRLLADGATEIQKRRHVELYAELEHAAKQGNVSAAQKHIDTILDNDPAGHGEIIRQLTRAHRDAVRQGWNTSAYDQLILHTGLRRTPSKIPVRESQILPTDGHDFYVPRQHAEQYAGLAKLPPGTRPSVGPDTPPPSFHARMVEETARLETLPDTFKRGSTEYVRISRPGSKAKNIPLYIGLSSAYVLHLCSDDGSNDTETCHGRTPAQRKEEAHRQKLLHQACSLGAKRAQELGITDCQNVPRP